MVLKLDQSGLQEALINLHWVSRTFIIQWGVIIYIIWSRWRAHTSLVLPLRLLQSAKLPPRFKTRPRPITRFQLHLQSLYFLQMCSHSLTCQMFILLHFVAPPSTPPPPFSLIFVFMLVDFVFIMLFPVGVWTWIVECRSDFVLEQILSSSNLICTSNANVNCI